MTTTRTAPRPERDEHQAPDDGADREEASREKYRELLEELRTIMPGAQVLLAFLLTVPFANGFDRVDDTGKALYTIALLAAAGSAMLFLAPAAHHRIASDASRERRIRYGVRVQLAGLGLLVVAVATGIFFVLRFLFDWRMALVGAAAIALLCGVVWLAIPAADERRHATAHRRD